MVQPEQRARPLVALSILSLGALAVNEFRQYQANGSSYDNPLAYAKARVQTVLQRFTRPTAEPEPDAWSAVRLFKPKYSPESTTDAVDSIASEKHPERNEDHGFSDPLFQSAGVFDGVSGNHGSEQASAIAAKISRDELRDIQTLQESVEGSLALMAQVLHKVDRAIAAVGTEIATTGIIAKLFKDISDRHYIAGAVVADARGYLFRDGELYFITYDEGYNDENVPDDVRKICKLPCPRLIRRVI